MRVATLRVISIVLGLLIAIIGLAHVAFGSSIVFDAGPFTPSIDSEDRFFGAIFVGYGLGWLLCASDPVRWRISLWGQSAIFLLGGIARIVSWIEVGRPHELYIWLMAIELAVPLLLFVSLAGLPGKASLRRIAP